MSESTESTDPGPPKTSTRRKVHRTLVVVGVLSLLWFAYALLTPELIDLPPDHLSVAPGLEAAQSLTALAAHLDVPSTTGNSVTLLVNGDEIFPAMLSSIREARESINLLTYVYWEGDVAEAFATELSAAAERGVEVRVLLDAFGARKIDERWINTMRRAGCDVAWFRPLRWDNLRRYSNRTHRKVLVVDGRVGFTGGVGIAEEWSGDARGPNEWRDDHFRVEGPAVRFLQGSFAENWRRARGIVLAGEKAFPPLHPVGGADVVPISSVANDRFSGIGFTYWMLFQSARHRIAIETPYYVPEPGLQQALLRAARRGVEVTLLVPGEHQDSTLVRYASRTYFRPLLDAGVRIFEYQPTLLHAKVVLIDDELSLVGSPNFDSRSIELNHEIALAVRDRSLVEALDVSLEEDMARSREVTLEEVDDWSMFSRALNESARLLREQL